MSNRENSVYLKINRATPQDTIRPKMKVTARLGQGPTALY